MIVRYIAVNFVSHGVFGLIFVCFDVCMSLCVLCESDIPRLGNLNYPNFSNFCRYGSVVGRSAGGSEEK